MIAKESEIERSYLKDSQLNGIAKRNRTIQYLARKIMPDDKLFVMVYAAWKKEMVLKCFYR